MQKCKPVLNLKLKWRDICFYFHHKWSLSSVWSLRKEERLMVCLCKPGAHRWLYCSGVHHPTTCCRDDAFQLCIARRMSPCSCMEGPAEIFSCFSSLTCQELSRHITWAGILTMQLYCQGEIWTVIHIWAIYILFTKYCIFDSSLDLYRVSRI